MRAASPPIRKCRVTGGYWIVAGRPVRAGYGFAKAAAFTMLALTYALQTIQSPWTDASWLIAQVLSWISLILCLLRGAPVVMQAFSWQKKEA
ncbi:MAG: hypothetical protein IPK16_09800 [Anaerolineales bacterium]|nr:hypothetical protein [Anaerolineales bacterium]